MAEINRRTYHQPKIHSMTTEQSSLYYSYAWQKKITILWILMRQRMVNSVLLHSKALTV